MTLRDRAAYEFIRSRLPDAEAYHTGDVIFTYCNGPMRENVGELPAGLPFGPDEKYFIISLRDFAAYGQALEDAVSDAGRMIAEKYGLRAVILPMQYEKDLRISLRVAESIGPAACVVPESFTGDKISLFAHARLIIGMRLHSLHRKAL